MNEELKQKLLHKDRWIRAFFMLIFAIVNYIVQMLIWVVAAAQFVIVLFTEKTNENLLHFGEGLSLYAYQIMQFLTYQIHDKPYPFASWPKKTSTE